MGGRGCAGWSGVNGEKWDNCDSIINKYIKKKKKNVPSFACKHPFPHSHVYRFSLSSRNTGVYPNLSDQKSVTFGLWSHLLVSLIIIIHRSS